jgi:hypothetical protein
VFPGRYVLDFLRVAEECVSSEVRTGFFFTCSREGVWKHTISLLLKKISSYLTGNTLLLCYTQKIQFVPHRKHTPSLLHVKNPVRTSMETVLLCYTKNSVRTSLETYYFSAAKKNQFVPHWKHTPSLLHAKIQFVPHWKHTPSLLHVKNPVRTSMETNSFSATHKESTSYLTGNILFLCYIFKNQVRTSLETHYFSATRKKSSSYLTRSTLLLCYTIKN